MRLLVHSQGNRKCVFMLELNNYYTTFYENKASNLVSKEEDDATLEDVAST
jgi:hypothetical protein